MTPVPPHGKRPSAWLLDVDDTLLDTAAAMRRAAPGAVQALDPDADAGLVERIGALYCDDADDAFGRFARGETSLNESRGERLAAAYRRAGRSLPREDADEDLASLGRRFEAEFAPRLLEHQRVFPDVGPALARALGSGIRVGLLTNASEGLTRQKLRATALATFPFVCVVTRDTLGFGKPDPRVFRHAATLLSPGEPLASIVYVGDAPDVDVLAAQEAGLSGVLINRTGRPARAAPEEMPVVTSLTELLQS